MTDKHSSLSGGNVTPLELLEKNYLYLMELYKLGRFEDDVDEGRFTFFAADRPGLRAGEETGRGRRRNPPPAPIKVATGDLYELAREIERAEPEAARDAAILILRVKILSYEVFDYYLDVPDSIAEFCLREARAIGEALREFGDSEKPAGPDPLVSYAERRYPQIRERGQQRELIQQLALVTLCGVNQLYRDHHDVSHMEALPLAEKLRRYIQHGLPKLSSPEHVSSGLLGLTLYMLGRLKFSVGDYEKADRDFVSSTEYYANRVHEKEAQQRQRKISLDEYQATRLLTLRRSALVSAFGSGFLSLVTSDLPAALKAIALARGIVKQNSGLVNSAYTDLLYCSVKRAQRSSDLSLLLDLRRILRRCLGVFRRYVPNRHYEHRAGIELALVHHYIAKADPRLGKRSYALAEKYLRQAVAFAGRKTTDKGRGRDDQAERPRNMRLLTEALTVLSHIIRHCSPGGMENITKAVDLARRAVVTAEDSKLYASEAQIALGAAHLSKAELLKGDGPAAKEALSDARVNFLNALAYNRGANARISAICFIRLGQICLREKETLGEALHWRDRWVAIKDKVHHEFCHQIGDDLEQSVERQSGVIYLLIDPEKKLERDYWLECLDNFLNNQAVYRVARKLSDPSAGETKKADGAITSSGGRDDLKKRLAAFFMDEVGFSKSTAYKWIDDHGLETRLRELLRK